MKQSALLLTLPLLATLAFADSPAPTDAAPPLPEPSAAPQEEATPPEYDWADERALYHNPVQSILCFVHDKASADAAALRVKALLDSQPEGAGLQAAPESWLYLYFGCGCFGSTELMDAMRRLQPKDFATAEQYRMVATPFLDELKARLDSLTSMVEQVKDADSAAKAAGAVDELPGFMEEWLVRGKEAISRTMEGATISREDAYVHLALEQIYPLPAVDRLRCAYGQLLAQAQAAFPALVQAMQKAWMPLEGMSGVTLEPDTITPEALAAEERLASALHEWTEKAAAISDKASADTAADWLAAKGEELGQPLMQAALHATANGGSRTAFLAILQEAIASYFELATPAWFGSEKLEQAMEADMSAIMPVPDVVPLREPDADEDAEGAPDCDD